MQKNKEQINSEQPQSNLLSSDSGEPTTHISLIPDAKTSHPSHFKFTINILQKQLEQLDKDKFERLAAGVNWEVVAKQADNLITEDKVDTLKTELTESGGK